MYVFNMYKTTEFQGSIEPLAVDPCNALTLYTNSDFPEIVKI